MNKYLNKKLVDLVLILILIIQCIVLISLNNKQEKLDVSVSVGQISSLRADGTILYKDQPFFPIGFYHVSWAGNQTNLTDAINKIADAGFNTMYIAPDESWTTALNTAKNRNLKLIVDGDGSDNAIEGVITSTKNTYDNILAWGIADDFNSTTKPKTIAQVNTLKNNALALDSTRLTFMSGTGAVAFNAPSYFPTGADLIGIQSYPIGDHTTTIDEVYDYMSRMVPAANAQSKPIIANLQTFAWPGKSAPTPTEIRNMTYQAIIAGVKGIVYYTYLDETWNLSNKAEMWTELQKIAPELNILAPVLLNGARTNIGRKNNIVASSFLKDGKTYFIAANTSRNNSSASFNLSSNSDLESKFAIPKTTYTIQNGSLSINLAPLEVIILESKTPIVVVVPKPPTSDPQDLPDTRLDCGLMDINADKKLTIVDFDKFVRQFKKLCKDTDSYKANPTIVKCGPMDNNLNGKIDIGDLGYVAKYFRKDCGV